MRAIYVDVKKERAAKIVDIEGKLDELYRMLDCDTIDIVTREFEGRTVNIIVDDNGLLESAPIVSCARATVHGGKLMLTPDLVGNLIITGLTDKEGDLMELPQSIAKTIMNERLFFSRDTADKEKNILIIAD